MQESVFSLEKCAGSAMLRMGPQQTGTSGLFIAKIRKSFAQKS
jgi:hypothetical protein